MHSKNIISFDNIMEINEAYFELSDRGDFVRIKLIKLAFPDAELDWDRNWLDASVVIKAGGFSGQFNTQLMTVDFENFKQELISLYTKLDGTANFNTMEGNINIRMKGDGIGHIASECKLMDYPGTGNKLEFRIDFDQTYIPTLIRQLDNIVQIFPITGTLQVKSEQTTGDNIGNRQ
jgi:hypothetical protein